MSSICCGVVVLSLVTAFHRFFPELEFAFPNKGGFTRAPFVAEEAHKYVLKALTDPRRDWLLAQIVKSRRIADEEWFDLRKIQISKGELASKSNLSRICWDYARFTDVDLAGADLNGLLMRGVVFDGVNLEGAVFDNAQLQGADFVNCSLSDVSFHNAHFDRQTRFRKCRMQRTRFDHCWDLRGGSVTETTMQGAVFRGSRLSGMRFSGVDLTGADFVDADLTDVDLCNTTINSVDLTDANLTRTKLQKAKLTMPLRLVRTKLFATHFGDLDISKVDFTYVTWANDEFRLGEEMEADEIASCYHDDSPGGRLRRKELYAQAESVYRALAQKYRHAGYLREYLELRYRFLETRRKYCAFEPMSFEFLWLNISRCVSGHDTRCRLLCFNFAGVCALFSLFYVCGIAFGSNWFKWYRTHPDGAQFQTGKQGEFIQSNTRIPIPEIRRRKGWLGLWLIACELSVEAMFKFVERSLNIPNIFHLIRRFDERPLPSSRWAKLLFGFEALLGLGFLFFASRLLVVVLGGF